MAMHIEDSKFDAPYPSVKNGIEGKKETPFTGIGFFNGGIPNYSTLEKLGSEEFNQIIQNVKLCGKMNFFEFAPAFQLMSSLEIPQKKELEALAIRKVKEQFGLPDEISEKLEAKLVEKVDRPSQDSDNLSQENKQDFQFTDDEKEIIRQHVEKRKIQNLLIMGAGYKAHSTFNSIKEDLDKINPALYPLYEKTMPNVALFMWKYPFEDVMDGVQMMGLSKIKKDENKEIKATAVATVFPILLHETAKAAIELLFAHYIISLTEKYGKNVAAEIIKQADVFEDEIWNKRIGNTLWKYLHDIIDYIVKNERDNDYTIVANLLHEISLMEPIDFMQFMNNLLYNGKESIATITKMVNGIEEELPIQEIEPIKANDNNYAIMSLEQLQTKLQNAIFEEEYEIAAEINAIIKSK